MDPNFNKFKNIEDQVDQTGLKDDNTRINLNPDIKIINIKKKGKHSSFSSTFRKSKHFIKKKRKKSGEKINASILNKSEFPEVLFNSITYLKHEIENKKNKKIKIEKDIQKLKGKMDKLNFDIENYEKIKNILETYNIDEEDIHKGKDEIKNDMENYYYDSNELNIFSLYKYSNPVKKLYSNTYLETKSLYRENYNSDNNKIGKEKLPIFENTSEKDKNLGNPFLNLETMNEVIELNGNDNKNNNRYEESSQYSFRCLTNNLNYKIKKGTKEIIIDLEYENNGKLAWPENETFLLIDETKSAFIIQKIYLYPLKPGEKYLSYIHFYNLDKFKQGLYINYFVFNVKGKDFGNNIKFTIEIY